MGKYYHLHFIKLEIDSTFMAVTLEVEPGSCDIFLLTSSPSILERKGQTSLSNLATYTYKAVDRHLVRNIDLSTFLFGMLLGVGERLK